MTCTSATPDYFIAGCIGKTRIDVILLSADDGRRSLVQTARKLSSAVSNFQLKCNDFVVSNDRWS